MSSRLLFLQIEEEWENEKRRNSSKCKNSNKISTIDENSNGATKVALENKGERDIRVKFGLMIKRDPNLEITVAKSQI